jgi:hypothetical protein
VKKENKTYLISTNQHQNNLRKKNVMSFLWNIVEFFSPNQIKKTILLVGNTESQEIQKLLTQQQNTIHKFDSMESLKTFTEAINEKETRILVSDRVTGKIPEKFSKIPYLTSLSSTRSIKHFLNFDPLYLSIESQNSGNLVEFISKKIEKILANKLSQEFSLLSIKRTFDTDLMKSHSFKFESFGQRRDSQIVFVGNLELEKFKFKNHSENLYFATSYPHYAADNLMKKEDYFSFNEIGGKEFTIIGGVLLTGNQCQIENENSISLGHSYDSILIRKEKGTFKPIKEKENEALDTILFKDPNQFFKCFEIKLKKTEFSYQQATNVFFKKTNTIGRYLLWFGNK